MKRYSNLSGRFWVAVATAGVASLVSTGCEVEKISCQTAHGDFTVALSNTGGTGECSELIGGIYGVQTYQYPNSDGTGPDNDHALMAIQAEDLGVLVDDYTDRLGDVPDSANAPYAKGDFATAKPDSDNICSVPTLTPAVQNFPALPAVDPDPEDPEDPGLPAEPATSYTYKWSNLRFYVSAAVTGTVFVGDLEYTHDGCTATYSAVGLYPAAFCDDENGDPDDNLCNAAAQPELGIAVGSGINPDFKTHCDPDLLLCVFDGAPPGF